LLKFGLIKFSFIRFEAISPPLPFAKNTLLQKLCLLRGNKLLIVGDSEDAEKMNSRGQNILYFPDYKRDMKSREKG
jgi:hypothetical protein